MGQIEEIIVGKTGTLTKAKMRVAHFIMEGMARVNSRKNTILNCELSEYNLLKLKESILYNTTALIETDDTSYVANGSPIDTCMIGFLQDADIPVHLMIQRKFGGRLLASRTFDTAHRTSVVAVQNFDDEETVTIYVKGAPEEVVEMCSQMQMNDNEAPVAMSDGSATNPSITNSDQVLADVSTYAKKGFKVICYAFLEISKATWDDTIAVDEGDTADINAVFRQKLTEEDEFTGFRLLSTVVLKDGLRPNAASAVEYARNEAQLSVRLVSNDHIDTAMAVARKAGILTTDEW